MGGDTVLGSLFIREYYYLGASLGVPYFRKPHIRCGGCLWRPTRGDVCCTRVK